MPTDNRQRFVAEVEVTLKQVVNDPQGLSVTQALHALGFSGVLSARVGKHIRLELEAADLDLARADVDQMCHRLLCNGVIEDFHFEVSREAG